MVLCLVSVNIHAFEMGINEAQTSPIATIYYTKDGASIRQSGILYLLGQYIAKHSQQPTQYTVIKINQVETMLANNTVQSICYTTPKWVHLPKKKVLFSKPFMSLNERLISAKPIPLIKKESDLYNLNIGLVKSYHYPALQKHMDNNFIKVEYYGSELYSFIALFRQQALDVIALKEVSFKHFMKTMPEIAQKKSVTLHPFYLSQQKIVCALPAAQKPHLAILNQAIDEFVADNPLN